MMMIYTVTVYSVPVVVELCCGLHRNVETPKSSQASVTEHTTKTADVGEVKQMVTTDKEQTASVLSKYVDLETLLG